MIGTNKKDATETVELLLEDAARRKAAPRRPGATAETVDELLAARGVEAGHVRGLGGDRPRGADARASRTGGRG